MSIKQKGSISLIVGLVLYVVAFGTIYLTWVKLLPQLRTTGQEKEQQSAEKKRLTTELQLLTQAKQTIASKKDQLDLLNVAVPDAGTSLPTVLLQMDTLVNRSGVSLTSLSPGLQPEGNSISLNATVQGSLPAIENFLDSLNTNLRLITVQTLDFTGSGDVNAIETKIQGSMLTVPTKTPAAPATSSAPTTGATASPTSSSSPNPTQ